MEKTDISIGFQIEEPNIFVPWGISEAELEQMFEKFNLRHVTNGYFATRCTSLKGLVHELGFHFLPRNNGALVELEFFQSSCPNLDTSYRGFQHHLEATFGQPTIAVPGSEGYPSHTWRYPGIEVVHLVIEHFGPAEHVRIKKLRRVH